MKKLLLLFLILSILFSQLSQSYASSTPKLPKGFILSPHQQKCLLSYQDNIYYIITVQDETSKDIGYVFLDTENRSVLDRDIYRILAQNALWLDSAEKIKEMTHFPIDRKSFLTNTRWDWDIKKSIETSMDQSFLKTSLRKFCLGSENILLYSLIKAGKLVEPADTVVFLGTMKWALRRSSWQNYWQEKEKIDEWSKYFDSTQKIITCLEEGKQIVAFKQDLFSSILYGNLYLLLNDRNRKEIWESLFRTITPKNQDSLFLLASRLSDFLFEKIIDPKEFEALKPVVIKTAQSYVIFDSAFEHQTNPTLPGSTAQKILESLTPKTISMFRFNAKRTGKSIYPGPTTEKLAWKKSLGDWVVSSPLVLTDQSILIGCFDGYLYHLSSTGDILWKFFAGSWIVSTPAVSQDGTIYFGNQNGWMFAVAKNGELIWKVNLGSMVGSSPAITGTGDILVGSFDGSMVCVRNDGTIKWKFPTGSWVLSSPALMDNGNIVFGSTDHHVYCLSPSGSLLWKYKTGNMVVGSPAVDELGRIYIGSLDQTFYCLAPDGTLSWKYPAKSWIISSASIGESQVYFAEKNGTIHALDLKGKQSWYYQTSGVLEGSPLLDKNEVLYITSWDRKLYVIDQGQLLWSFTFESESRSTPTLSKEGTLYVGAEDSAIYAFSK